MMANKVTNSDIIELCDTSILLFEKVQESDRFSDTILQHSFDAEIALRKIRLEILIVAFNQNKKEEKPIIINSTTETESQSDKDFMNRITKNKEL